MIIPMESATAEPEDAETARLDAEHFEQIKPERENPGPGQPSPIEEKARIHAALEQCSGNRNDAAAMLGLTLQELRNRIVRCPDLRLRWTSRVDAACPEPPDDLAAMMMEQPITSQQERLAEVIKQEERRLKDGLVGLKLNERETEMALALQAFNRENFSSQLGIVNSSITRFVIKHAIFMENCEKRLDQVRAVLFQMGQDQDDTRGFWVEEEEKLAQQYLQGGDLLRKIMAESFRGNQILAMIQFRLKCGGMKKVKPGFQDIDANTKTE